MKLLLVCMGTPHGVGGGNIGAHKAYTCIKEICTENGIEFKCISLDNNPEENLSCNLVKNRPIDILARILGHTTFLYVMWLKYRSKIYAYKPDVVVLINSRLGFIAKDLKTRGLVEKCIVGFENVESDYAIAPFAQMHSLPRALFTRIEKIFVRLDEKATLKYADQLIFLSDRDRKRTAEIYKMPVDNSVIIPACIQSKVMLSMDAEKPTVAFVASLRFKQNVVSLLWFMDNVWDKYFTNKSGIELIVAGAEPLPIVEERLTGYTNIKLYKGFKQMPDIIPKGALHVSPITIGAGMKVKIAEALAAGLHILGTDEALVGYDEIIGVRGITVCNTPEEYRDGIERYVAMGKDELADISRENQVLFTKSYTYKRAKAGYEKALQIVVMK